MSKKTPPNMTDPAVDDLDSFDLDSFLNSKEPTAKLTDKQMDALENYLDSVEKAMHLEVLDGFFCAMITGSDIITPDEYLPHVFGGKMPTFKSSDESGEILGALSQHWEHIHSVVSNGNPYYPFLYADMNEKCSANDWAYGFILGIDLRRDAWMKLVEESKEKGLLTPILALYSEHIPGISGGEIPADEREEMVTEIVTNLPKIYQHFHQAEDESSPGNVLH